MNGSAPHELWSELLCWIGPEACSLELGLLVVAVVYGNVTLSFLSLDVFLVTLNGFAWDGIGLDWMAMGGCENH